MRKTQIIFLALVASWFLCSEGPNNDTVISEEAVMGDEGVALEVSEAANEDNVEQANSVDTSETVKRWVKMGTAGLLALVILIII